jgi:hypothetical protein
MFGLIILALWLLIIIIGYILYKNAMNNFITKICNKYNKLETTNEKLNDLKTIKKNLIEIKIINSVDL